MVFLTSKERNQFYTTKSEEYNSIQRHYQVSIWGSSALKLDQYANTCLKEDLSLHL